jgi:uncharacterized protein with PIN domain
MRLQQRGSRSERAFGKTKMYCPKCNTHLETMPDASIETERGTGKHHPDDIVYYCPKCGTVQDVDSEAGPPKNR